MRDKEADDSKSGDPIWLVTFGDSMSLLLTFFVLLFTCTPSDKAGMKEVLGYLSGSLGYMEQTKPTIVPPLVKKLDRKSVGDEIRDFIRQQGLEDFQASISVVPEGVLINLDSPLLFSLGQADLKEKTISLLDNIAEVVKELPNEINIGGHTDDLPIHTRRFPSNWELSAARAIAVANRFIQKGILPARLSVAGYADSRPLFPNDSEEHRALNRRVEILIRNRLPVKFP